MRLAEYEEAVGTHKNRVYTLAFYLLGRREDAEEILQEVLLRLWRHRRTVEQERMGAWLAKVTRNACYDHLRRQKSAGRDLVNAVESEVLERAPSDDRDPEALATSADVLRRVHSELLQLAEPYRSVLVLREVQELKYQEISDVLELPLNTVRVYLHRGRRKLRERLGGLLGETSD